GTIATRSMLTTLFTGAGASYSFGYPLTRDLLPMVRRQIRDETLFEKINGPTKDRRDRDALYSYLSKLLPGFKRASDGDLPLITGVFSLVEHAIVSETALPTGGDTKLRHFRDLLKQAIADVLLGEYLEPWDDGDPKHRNQRRLLKGIARWFRNQSDEIGLVS